MRILLRSSSPFLIFLLVSAVLVGCGGGSSSTSPAPTATLPPNTNTNAFFNLTVTNGTNGNYTGPAFKSSGFFTDRFSASGAYRLSCLVEKDGGPPQTSEGLYYASITLFGSLEQGKVFFINPPLNSPASSAAASVLYAETSENDNPNWDDNTVGNGGQIIVRSLSSTSVTFKFENVVLPARPATRATGTVILNGTITATFPQ